MVFGEEGVEFYGFAIYALCARHPARRPHAFFKRMQRDCRLSSTCFFAAAKKSRQKKPLEGNTRRLYFTEPDPAGLFC